MTDARVPDPAGASATATSAPAADPAAELFDDRYGRGRQRGFDKRFGWIAGGVLLLGGLVFVLFGGWHQTSDLEFKTLHYAVIDDRTVMVDAQVTAPANTDVVCVIEALSTSRATVGWKLVELPASDERTRRFTADTVTTGPATTGTVRECWVLTD